MKWESPIIASLMFVFYLMVGFTSCSFFIEPSASAPLEGMPPKILIEAINETVTTSDWSYEIRAADNETPEEFLTFSITSIEWEYSRYFSMQGNWIVATGLKPGYDSVRITIEVMDTDGLTDSAMYDIYIDIDDPAPMILSSIQTLTVTGMNAYFFVGTGPQCDVRYHDPHGDQIYIDEVVSPDMTLNVRRDSDREGVDYRVEVRRGWIYDDYPSHPFIGGADLVFDIKDEQNSVRVTITVHFLPLSDMFRIVPLVNLDDLTDRDPVILGIGMVGVEGLLFHNLSSVYWDSNRTSIDDEYSPIMKDVLSAGHHNISVEFDLTDDDTSSEYEVYIHIYVHPTEDRVERTDDVGGEICLFALLSMMILPLLIVSPAVIGSIVLKVVRRRGR
ncbi:MAG: hypothetical protein QCI82_01530 [Candidatus Thermoplasmatota archaeon]|nr:hypothetical protein [Candidatus Thermoplasmatota archaeon]